MRVHLEAPLSPAQELVTRLVSEGKASKEIAVILNVSVSAVRFHVHEAAKKVPGTLPARSKLAAWYRGASLTVLNGGGS